MLHKPGSRQTDGRTDRDHKIIENLLTFRIHFKIVHRRTEMMHQLYLGKSILKYLYGEMIETCRLVVLESGLGLESGLESIFTGLGLGLGLEGSGLGLGLETPGLGLGLGRRVFFPGAKLPF